MKIIIQRDRRTKDPLYKNKKKIKNKNKKIKIKRQSFLSPKYLREKLIMYLLYFTPNRGQTPNLIPKNLLVWKSIIKNTRITLQPNTPKQLNLNLSLIEDLFFNVNFYTNLSFNIAMSCPIIFKICCIPSSVQDDIDVHIISMLPTYQPYMQYEIWIPISRPNEEDHSRMQL